MKTNLFLVALVAIFFSFFVVSCNQPTQPKTGPGVSKTTLCETPVTVKVKQTATKYSCNGIPNGEKVTGEKDSTFLVIQETNCAYSDRDLNIAGYQYKYTKSLSDPWWSGFWNSGFMNLVKWFVMGLLALILLLVLFALLLWAIGEVEESLRRRRINTPPPTNVPPAKVTNIPPTTPSGNWFFVPTSGNGGLEIKIKQHGTPSSEVIAALRERGGSMSDEDEKGSGYNLDINPPTPTAPPAGEKKEDASQKA